MKHIKQTFHYNSDLLGGSLMVRESRIIADLLLSNVSAEEWHEAIQIENCLQKRSPATAKRTAQAIRKRLERIDPECWLLLRDGDQQVASQVAFYSVLERNLLLVEFIETVVQDAFITQAERLHNYQWTDFLEERSHRDVAIKQWTEASRKKMGQIVFRMLAEVGLLYSTRKPKLQTLLLCSEVRALLAKHATQRISACFEVSLHYRSTRLFV